MKNTKMDQQGVNPTARTNVNHKCEGYVQMHHSVIAGWHRYGTLQLYCNSCQAIELAA